MITQATGLKIKLDIEPQASQLLDSQSKICNWLYNHLLETANALKARFIARDGQDEEAAKRAEKLLENGFLDMTVPRSEMKATVARTLKLLTHAHASSSPLAVADEG